MKADKTNKQTTKEGLKDSRNTTSGKKEEEARQGEISQQSYYVGCRGSKKRSTGSLGCRRSSLKTATKEKKKTKNQSESETKENNFKKMLPNNTI